MVLVGEEDEDTRVIIQELLQPTKQTEIVVASFLCAENVRLLYDRKPLPLILRGKLVLPNIHGTLLYTLYDNGVKVHARPSILLFVCIN